MDTKRLAATVALFIAATAAPALGAPHAEKTNLQRATADGSLVQVKHAERIYLTPTISIPRTGVKNAEPVRDDEDPQVGSGVLESNQSLYMKYPTNVTEDWSVDPNLPHPDWSWDECIVTMGDRTLTTDCSSWMNDPDGDNNTPPLDESNSYEYQNSIIGGAAPEVDFRKCLSDLGTGNHSDLYRESENMAKLAATQGDINGVNPPAIDDLNSYMMFKVTDTQKEWNLWLSDILCPRVWDGSDFVTQIDPLFEHTLNSPDGSQISGIGIGAAVVESQHQREFYIAVLLRQDPRTYRNVRCQDVGCV